MNGKMCDTLDTGLIFSLLICHFYILLSIIQKLQGTITYKYDSGTFLCFSRILCLVLLLLYVLLIT